MRTKKGTPREGSMPTPPPAKREYMVLNRKPLPTCPQKVPQRLNRQELGTVRKPLPHHGYHQPLTGLQRQILPTVRGLELYHPQLCDEALETVHIPRWLS